MNKSQGFIWLIPWGFLLQRGLLRRPRAAHRPPGSLGGGGLGGGLCPHGLLEGPPPVGLVKGAPREELLAEAHEGTVVLEQAPYLRPDGVGGGDERAATARAKGPGRAPALLRLQALQ